MVLNATASSSFAAVIVAGAVASAAAQATARLPTLSQVRIAALDSVGPETRNTAFAISNQGTLAFTGSFDPEGRMITVVDQRGRVARFGKKGRGPGEITLPVQLAFVTTGLVVVEATAGRLSVFGAYDGALKSTVVTGAGLYLLSSVGDSLDFLVWPRTPGGISDYRRVSAVDLGGRTVLAGNAPTLTSIGADANLEGSPVKAVLFASVGSNTVAANVATYRLEAFNAVGQSVYTTSGPSGHVAPGQPRMQLMGGLQGDAKGRAWVVTDDDASGQSVADIFAGPNYLGRLKLGCKGTLSLAGEWAAMLCTNTSQTNDVALRILRVVE